MTSRTIKWVDYNPKELTVRFKSDGSMTLIYYFEHNDWAAKQTIDLPPKQAQLLREMFAWVGR